MNKLSNVVGLVVVMWLSMGCISATQRPVVDPRPFKATSFEVVKVAGVEPEPGSGWESGYGFTSSLQQSMQAFGFNSSGGKKVVVRYEIEDVEEGSRALRLVAPFVAGTGKFVVWSQFLVDGKDVGSLRTEVNLNVAYSFRVAVDRASYEIAQEAARLAGL